MKVHMTKWSRFTLFKLIIISLGLLLIISILGFGVFAISNTSGFCATCHEMKPEYATWQVSSHSQISCTDCHDPISKTAQITSRLSYVKRIFKHLTGNYDQPIREKEPLSQKICLQCHKPERVIQVGIDLKIPHLRHISKGILCVSCHSGVVHGHISERNLNAKDTTANWDTKNTKAIANIENTKVSMEQCIECHRLKNVAISCETCHATFSRPVAHNDGEWLEEHGIVAKYNVDFCNSCHSYTNEKRLGSKELTYKNPETQYARNNTFCNSCHTTNKPASHIEPWNIKHADLFQEGIVECYVCHDQNPPKSDHAVEGIYCNKCHGKFATTLDISNVYQ